MSKMGDSSKNLLLSQLTSVTPLDGRYRDRIAELSSYTSEYALIKTRIEVEIKYLIALSEENIIRKLTAKEKESLLSFAQNIDLKTAEEVKKTEDVTRHDVKAVEMVLRKFIEKSSMKDLTEFIHFGLTSEDINNISYRLILKRTTQEVLIPVISEIISEILKLAQDHNNIPMLARTHGQSAVPTTLGKEMAVFVSRLSDQSNELKSRNLTGKLSGAVGNFNALYLAFPKTDWVRFSERFISSLGLTPNMITTQINSYDDISSCLQNYQRINNILIGFNQDVWRYVSDGWFVQVVKQGEVGSSTMPQKVNPIDFENSEGNLGLSNSMLEFMAGKLMVSRLQRDLSDSTVIRNMGTALGFSLMGYKSTLAGLSRIKPNEEKISEDLNSDWAILTEAAQTLLRKNGVKNSYELVMSLSRGKKIKKEEWQSWVEKLPLDQDSKKILKDLTPEKYTGLSSELSELALTKILPKQKNNNQ